MFSTIVVGIDGREGGQDALALARTLAGPGTSLVAVNAFLYELMPSRGTVLGFEEELRAEAASELEAWVPDEDVERRVVADLSPGRALHRAADELGADLIVVGSAHHGPVGRILLGDVSRSTVHGAPCAVAVAPHGYRESGPLLRAVGTGYVETPEAEEAFRVAVELAKDRDAQLRVVTAVPPPTPLVYSTAYAFDWGQLHEKSMRAARRTLESVTRELELSVICDVSEDAPGRALVALSRAVDLIVAGSRGWGPVRTMLLGGASDTLVHEAHCPVLLVPGAERREGEATDVAG